MLIRREPKLQSKLLCEGGSCPIEGLNARGYMWSNERVYIEGPCLVTSCQHVKDLCSNEACIKGTNMSKPKVHVGGQNVQIRKRHIGNKKCKSKDAKREPFALEMK